MITSHDQQYRGEAPDVNLLSKDDNCSLDDAESDTKHLSTARKVLHYEKAIGAQLARKQSLVYLAIFVSMGLMVGSVGPLMPLIYANIRAREEGAADPAERDGRLVPVFVARGIGGLAGSLLGGALIERSPLGGAHRVLAAGILLTAIGTGAMPLCAEATPLAPRLSRAFALPSHPERQL